MESINKFPNKDICKFFIIFVVCFHTVFILYLENTDQHYKKYIKNEDITFYISNMNIHTVHKQDSQKIWMEWMNSEISFLLEMTWKLAS